jgi:REP element-mobilizing transposase RayT
MNKDINTISFHRRHLPHWIVADRSYFVTIRLKGSLPKSVILDLICEYKELRDSLNNEQEINECYKTQFKKVEAILDSAKSGPLYLQQPPIAELVMRAFDWLESKYDWDIQASTIMPNHIHLLLRNRNGNNHLLSQHLGILKGYTAKQANKILNRQGSFWMDENFDHWCRNYQQLERSAQYIFNNPVKAGLVRNPHDWPWSRCKFVESD